MIQHRPVGITFTDPAPLLWAIDQCNNKRIAIEVGTYYGGWTRLLSNAYNNVITLQIMSNDRLMHHYKTQFDKDRALYANTALPKKYHTDYNFNYMVENLRNMNGVVPILMESPPIIEWHWKFDLCTIDITRRPEENFKQYNYWKQHANPGAIMLMGVYKLFSQDTVVMTLDQFMSNIDTHCDFVPGYEDYIYIKF